LSVRGWIAIGAILVLQGYLLLGGATEQPTGATPEGAALTTSIGA
jgi:hypothetical protein